MARALTIFALLGSSFAGAAPTIGMNGHLPSAADCQRMQQLGVRSVRVDFNWFDLEPQQGQWSWALGDDVLRNAASNGLSVYATIAYTPQWASSLPSCVPLGSSDATKCQNKRPANVQQWSAAISQIVTRYRGQVECWGIWNEPNLRTFFDGTLDQFVNEIFLPAAQAIRAADPSAKICGPELAGLTTSSNWNGNQGTCVAGQCIRNGWERDLGQLLTRVGPQLDVITHHTYKGDAAGVMRALLDGETTAGVLTHDSVKHVIEQAGQGHKEFWLTETGWEHPPQGTTALPDVATRIVELYAKQEEICAGTYPASLVDPWRNWTRTWYFHFPYDPGSGWGLVDQSGQPLAPFSALQNWAMGRTTTACGLGVIDAGTALDAGSALDAGGAFDAGHDGVSSIDAGTRIDAGHSSDAGDPLDAGMGGASDAGAITPDAGVQADAGVTSALPSASPGCGCSSIENALLVLGLLPFRRRRHRAG